MDKVRIDKWLWSVRIFKSRTLSGKECKNGNVSCKDKKLKPSSLISLGDEIFVSKNGFNLHFKAKKLIEKRVSATLAVECYEDLTSPDELNKFKDWFVGKGSSEKRAPGSGRPTKKDRREIEIFKETIEYDFDD